MKRLLFLCLLTLPILLTAQIKVDKGKPKLPPKVVESVRVDSFILKGRYSLDTSKVFITAYAIDSTSQFLTWFPGYAVTSLFTPNNSNPIAIGTGYFTVKWEFVRDENIQSVKQRKW